jgi:hypothetical protein
MSQEVINPNLFLYNFEHQKSFALLHSGVGQIIDFQPRCHFYQKHLIVIIN